ncbi:hypothetical protein [Candidatus Phytoplasma pruni]|nr:hypothetical protein [Candidatus Phytoplasma pruni]
MSYEKEKQSKITTFVIRWVVPSLGVVIPLMVWYAHKGYVKLG